MPDSHITDPHTQTMLTGSTWRQIAEFKKYFFLMKLNKHKLIYIWPQLKYLKIHS